MSPMMRPTKEKSIELLRRAVERVRAINSRSTVSMPEAEIWIRDTKLAISNIFGGTSEEMTDFLSALAKFAALPEGVYDRGRYFKRTAVNLVGLLESLTREVEDFWPDDPPQHPSPVVAPDPSPAAPGGPPNVAPNRDIFIIHGHDHATKEEVARFLSNAGLNPIILHEQSNRGRSVVEKFEDYASVTYAVALLTPDDVGAAQASAHELRPRPRQNVLFEFGYFIGKLGRTRVCGLSKGDVEIPSDYSGVLLISLDKDSWRLELLREIRDAGLPIDIKTL